MAETGYRRSPKLNKGALVQLSDSLIDADPVTIPFQYNPQTVSRTLTPWNPFEVSETGRGQLAPTAQPFDPKEQITLEIELDAADKLEDDDDNAKQFGVADRIAAIERLLLPQQGALDQLLSAVPVETGIQPAERPTGPVVLFAWGPGRLLPVRITSYSFEEQMFLPNLEPLMAKISLGMEVLTPDVFKCQTGPAVEFAIAVYRKFRLDQNRRADRHTSQNVDAGRALLTS
jgi:hypothetical protein